MGLVEAKLELGVGDDDAPIEGVACGKGVQLECVVANLSRNRWADQRDDLVVADVLVVLADGSLGRRREDWLRQPIGHAQARRQLDPADPPGALVVLPARADQVAAHHRLDRQRPQTLNDHRTAGEHGEFGRVMDPGRQFVVGEVIRHDVLRAREPEVRDLGQHAPLARDGVGQHDVKCGQPVGRDDQHVPGVELIEVAHLPAVDQAQSLESSLVYGIGWHGGSCC